MTEQEDDYMSDSFLLQSESVKPGLAWGKLAKQNKKESRHIEFNKTSKKVQKPLKIQQREQLEEGLQNAISSDNKGFAMLQKMGYKKGMGLGKTGTGRKEPVPIAIKTDRGGLGREAQVKKQKQEVEQFRERMRKNRMQNQEKNKGEFLQRVREKQVNRGAEKDFYQSQKVCEQLDRTNGVEEPVVLWYWPKHLRPKTQEEDNIKECDMEEEEDEEEEEKDVGDDIPIQERLDDITRYLRTKYVYCIWCGTSFNDGQDLAENCPGDDADAHS
ncbi:G patch domain-containing protein 11-like [Anneissia japonica]|uniref:G patch domain-containing protein 11-like n=1 Tax=Anneissia japonica TaxID=1529436 RepID=UPI00142590F6|nr:G patch domain-containing protein 11-like [Anneissia japonica]